MTTLLMRLSGPMQSWGVQSRFSQRDTGLEPSRSGVLGLVCAALGRPRTASLDDLRQLRMGVRADREGRLARDFHTALEVIKADGSRPDTVVSERFYLAGAVFLVGLEGDPGLLQRIDAALQAPVWQMFLGRKAFVPDAPVWLPNGLRRGVGLIAALRACPWLAQDGKHPQALRLVLESEDGSGETRHDVPLSFATRQFALRQVRTDWMAFTDLPPVTTEEPCS